MDWIQSGINTFESWLASMDQGITDATIGNAIFYAGEKLLNLVQSVIPDLVGYSAMWCAISVMFSPLNERSIIRDVGNFAGILMVSLGLMAI